MYNDIDPTFFRLHHVNVWCEVTKLDTTSGPSPLLSSPNISSKPSCTSLSMAVMSRMYKGKKHLFKAKLYVTVDGGDESEVQR